MADYIGVSSGIYLSFCDFISLLSHVYHMGTLKGRKQPMPGDLGSPHQPGAGRKGQLAPLGVPVLWFPHRCPLHMAGPHPRATSSHRNETRSFISLGSIITSFLSQTTFCFLLLFSYMTQPHNVPAQRCPLKGAVPFVPAAICRAP